MNPTSLDPTAPPPPPPPQPPRSSFSCDRHPAEQFTGFCPSCLCERLHTLDQSSNNTPSSSRRPSSASVAIKSLFTSTSKPNNLPPPAPKPAKTSFFPELRRTKSFSASKNEALGFFFEPQRKSCDVRVRNTLSSLFTLDNEYKGNKPSISTFSPSFQQNHQNSIKIESENDKDFKDPSVAVDTCDSSGDEIRSVHEENSSNAVEVVVINSEIVEEETVHLKAMKDHIDMDIQEKKSSGGGIWAAASVFGKKWHNWRRKQKMKKHNTGESNFATLPVEKPISRQYRETQSEIADYGFGRRSCDTGPRFSLDAGRISFDDPRYSFDEPRASWDGYLIGGRSLSRMAPMVSVMEDAPPPSARSDMQIPVEEDNDGVPGGSTQTREYYSDSFSRRRKSLDRSSSLRKTVVAEIDELNSVSNAKVSPTTADCFHGTKAMVGEREFKDDCSENSNCVIAKEAKKSRRWSSRIWGFIQKRNGGNSRDDDEDEKYSRVNGVDRSYSGSWQEMRGEGNGGFNRHMFRSNSSVSWRDANHIGGMKKSSFEMNGGGKKRREEFVLKKNRSARYSPNHVDNGLLRLYLAPLRSNSQRGGKMKANNAQSIARSVLRLY